jgi:hypothetical protein
MDNVVTRDSVIERVRKLPAHLLEEADLLLAELTPISDEEWLKILEDAPIDDEPLSLKELISLDRENLRREERRAAKQAGKRSAV